MFTDTFVNNLIESFKKHDGDLYAVMYDLDISYIPFCLVCSLLGGLLRVKEMAGFDKTKYCRGENKKHLEYALLWEEFGNEALSTIRENLVGPLNQRWSQFRLLYHVGNTISHNESIDIDSILYACKTCDSIDSLADYFQTTVYGVRKKLARFGGREHINQKYGVNIRGSSFEAKGCRKEKQKKQGEMNEYRKKLQAIINPGTSDDDDN